MHHVRFWIDTALRAAFPLWLPATPNYCVALTHEKPVANVSERGRIIRVFVEWRIIHQDEVDFVAAIDHSVKNLVVTLRQIDWFEDVECSTIGNMSAGILCCFVEIDDIDMLGCVGIDLTKYATNKFLVLANCTELLTLEG